MSAGVPCSCSGTRKEKMKNWVVWQYRCNHSAFSGYYYTQSNYSQIRCMKCSGTWRTKANYVLNILKNNRYENSRRYI